MEEAPQEVSFTPGEVAATAAIGVAVIVASFGLRRLGRWWKRLDPFARPRERIARTSANYRQGRDRVSAATELAQSLNHLLGAVQALNREAAGPGAKR